MSAYFVAPQATTYESVVLPHVESLRRAALRLTRGRREDAEDLVQDTLTRAFDRIHTYRPLSSSAVSEENNARAWTHTIQRRLFLSRLPKQRREAATSPLQPDGGGDVAWAELLPDTSPEADPENALLRRAAAAALQEAVSGLPDEYRAPLLLVAGEGLPYDEAAERLGVPSGTLRSRVFRARRLLHARVGHWFDASS